MQANLVNKQTNAVKTVKVGFSWTTFFFGFFPALFRADWKWFSIMLLSTIVVGASTMGYGSFLVSLVFCFIYNKLYVNDLLNNGFQPMDDSSYKILLSKGYIQNARIFD